MQPQDRNMPLLTIDPKSGVVLLLIGGHILPFTDVDQTGLFIEQLKDELDGLKLFVSDQTAASTAYIDNNYAQNVIQSWEQELSEQKPITSSRKKSRSPKKLTIKEKRQKTMASETSTKRTQKIRKGDTQRETGVQQQEIKSSKSRVQSLKQLAAVQVPNDFDPDEISWVSDYLGITDWEGGLKAKDLGYYVINVAEEIVSNADVKWPVMPPKTDSDIVATHNDVERVADLIDRALEWTPKKVVVHCYMGMERSVLCVVMYMTKYLGMDLDQAYEEVSKVRPIAADRRQWIGM